MTRFNSSFKWLLNKLMIRLMDQAKIAWFWFDSWFIWFKSIDYRSEYTYIPTYIWYGFGLIHLFVLFTGQSLITVWTSLWTSVIQHNPSALFISYWRSAKTGWTPARHSALPFVIGHNLRHRQNNSSVCDNGSSEDKMVARSAKSIGVVHKHRPIVDNFRPMLKTLFDAKNTYLKHLTNKYIINGYEISPVLPCELERKKTKHVEIRR